MPPRTPSGVACAPRLEIVSVPGLPIVAPGDDLGALLVVNAMRERLGKEPARIVNVVMEGKGGVSGGTIAR